MKKFLILLGLLLVALGVVLWRLPASLLVSALPQRALPYLSFHHVEGTLWRGRIDYSTLYIPATLVQHWDCRPGLNPLGLHCTLDGNLRGQARLDALSQSLHLQDSTAEFPFDFRLPGFQVQAPALQLQLQSARLSQQQLALQGHLIAQQAQIQQGTQRIALGEVSLDCRPDDSGGASRCQLSNRGAEAQLNGQLTLQPQGPRGQLELRPRPNAPPLQLRF